MTDKQIVVDGVDVSECNFCDWKSSDIPQCRIRLTSFEPTCKGYNCYYKQLTREKQECEKTKQTLAEIKEIAEPYNDMSGNCVIVNVFKDMCKILQKISEVEDD